MAQAVLCFAAAFIFSSGALASFGNYNSILIGDQASGMGGAYTAMASDASAMAWYNPAGFARLRGKSFSAAVGIYKKFDIRYGGGDDFTKASLKVNQGFFRALPSSTGSVVRFESLPGWTMAFSILVPQYEFFKGDIRNNKTNLSSLTMIDESLWVGGAISKRISAKETMGLSLFYTARSFSKSVFDRSTEETRRIIYQEERQFTQNHVVPIFGYQLQFLPDWRLGFSWRGPAFRIAGSGSYFSTTLDSTVTTVTEVNDTEIDSKAAIPQRYSTGIAWQVYPELVISADVSYYGREQYRDLESDIYAENLVNQNVWNGAIGAEYNWDKHFRVRVGGFTNLSSHPDPEIGKVRGQGDRVDQLGFAANAALGTGKIQYTFGGYYTGGRGRSVQRVEQTYIVVPKTMQVFTMLVGTSYAF